MTTIDGLLSRFREIVLHDFEFVLGRGERPDVVCVAWHELRSGRCGSLWRDELGEQPPYPTGPRVLFVNFVANAECGCHLALNWPLPAHVLDLNPAFRNITSGRWTPEGKGLIGALRYYGHDTVDAKRKDAMQRRVMRGWPFAPEERQQILTYCASDVAALHRLLVLMLPEIDLEIALHHGEFVAASAAMEHRGVPIDTEIFNQLADKDTWRAVRDDMVPEIDARYGVYVRDKAGDWSFNLERFATYLKREGIVWPLHETGKLDLRSKTFTEMAKGWPQLEELRQLRHTRNKMRKVKLAVGAADGRNRTVLWPFKSKTSRTQPKAAEWIFSPAVWLRTLIKPGPGQAVAHIDFSSMEFLIAASLSDKHCCTTNSMLEMYESGDPYLSFAKSVGAVPATATKRSHAATRQKYKIMLLAVQYGMSVETLAGRLGTSTFEARIMLDQHREQFAQYWSWSDDWVAHALQAGTMRTPFGWTYQIGHIERQVNERSIRNWPIQSVGADILRISCILATRHGINTLAPNHDAVLVEAAADRIDADVALMREIMRRASRIVLNSTADGTHELRTDADVIKYPGRYTDARGAAIWEHVLELLAKHDRAKRTA